MFALRNFANHGERLCIAKWLQNNSLQNCCKTFCKIAAKQLAGAIFFEFKIIGACVYDN